MIRAKRRDANEGAIVEALQAVGAAVQRLDGEGVPDLLVCHAGIFYLLEVKLPLTARGAVQKGRHYNSRGGRGDLTPAQVKWWDAWKGTPPVVVRTPADALAAIGAMVSLDGPGRPAVAAHLDPPTELQTQTRIHASKRSIAK